MGESSLREVIENLASALEKQLDINKSFRERIEMLEARMDNLYTGGVKQ